MPLGSRDILLVVRARNEASGVLGDIGRMLSAMGAGSRTTAQNMQLLGAGLTAVGAGFLVAGGAALAFYSDAISSAIEYNRQAALTLTQVDQVGVSVGMIGDIAKRVAKEVPAPFDQMQAVLFDIFSSMNTDIAGSERLLTAFSKGAVAGQVDIQAAGRATISIMNSFKIPVEDVNHVMDVQFQLVRKGVGTYQEFAEVMGRVTPAAVAAGQSIESMAGMLAFLTRNGLSTAMASTSAARAMELLTNPKSTKALEDMGVKVKDASGEFLQMKDIVRQLVFDKGWGKMTGPELKQAFKDTFGTGSIQARRFFDLVIPNFQQFSDLTDDMQNSAGAMDVAYKTMFDQPASKIVELQNRFEIFKVEVGERLMFVFEGLADAATKLMDAWDELDPGTQDMIIKIGLLAAVLAVVVGVVLTVTGLVLLFAGAAAAAGVSLAVVIGVVGGIVVAFGALVAIVYVIIRNWETLVEWFGPKMEIVKAAATEVWAFVQQKIQEFIGWVQSTAIPFALYMVQSITEQWNMLVAWWGEHVAPVITAITEFMMAIWNVIQFFWDIIKNFWEAAGTPILVLVKGVWDTIYMIISGVMSTIWNVIVAVWNGIKGFIEGILQAIQGVFQLFTGILTLDWTKAWEGIKNIFGGIWNAIFALVTGALGAIKEVITGVLTTVKDIVWGLLQAIWNVVGSIWDGIVHKTEETWNSFMSKIRGALDTVFSWFAGFHGVVPSFFHIDLWSIGRSIIDSLWGGLKSAWEDVKNWFGSITSMIPKLKGPADKDRRLLTDNGLLIMKGLSAGLDRGWNDVSKQLAGYNPMISGAIGLESTYNGSTRSVGSDQRGTRGDVSITVQAGAFTFNIDNATQDTARVVQQAVQQTISQLADEWAGFNTGAP